jgi:DNA-directed RNA polymerase beta' subunit
MGATNPYRKHEVCYGEAVGIIAAQSVGQSVTQKLLRSIHLAGSASRTVEVLPAIIAILDASRSSRYTKSIFRAYDEYGVEAARNKIIEELSKVLNRVGRRHLALIADMMTFSGEVEGLNAVIARKSVLARAAHQAANNSRRSASEL